MADAVLIPKGILQSFIESLDMYLLGDAADIANTPAEALQKYNLQSNVNPVAHTTHSPFIRYVWIGGELSHDQIFVNNLDVIVVVTSESAEGPQSLLTSILEDLYNVLHDADDYSLPVKSLDGRVISVHEFSPHKWDTALLIDSKQNYRLTGTIHCTVTMRR